MLVLSCLSGIYLLSEIAEKTGACLTLIPVPVCPYWHLQLLSEIAETGYYIHIHISFTDRRTVRGGSVCGVCGVAERGVKPLT